MMPFPWNPTVRFVEDLARHRGSSSQLAQVILQSVGPAIGFGLPQGPECTGAHFKSPRPAKDVDQFPEILGKALSKAQEYEGTPEKDRVEVRAWQADLPPERDVITWRLKDRYPGLYGRGKAGDKKVQEYTKHPRQVCLDPTSPGEAVVVHGQYMDNLIELCVWSQDVDRSNQLALWLERTMEEFAWYFLYEGFTMLFFHERGEDQHKEVGGHHLYARPLCFFVRTEKLTPIRIPILRQVVSQLVIKPTN